MVPGMGATLDPQAGHLGALLLRFLQAAVQE